MDTTEFDTKIAQAETEILKGKEVCEAKLRAFLDAATVAMQAWAPLSAKRFVVTHDAVTAQLAAAGKLTDLKADIATAIAAIPDAVTKTLGSTKIWPHNDDYQHVRSSDYLAQQGNRKGVYRIRYSLEGKSVDERLKDAASDVVDATIGRAFVERGYPMSGRKNTMTFRSRYGESFPFPDSIIPVLHEYVDANDHVQDIYGALSKLRTERQKAVAAHAWDND